MKIRKVVSREVCIVTPQTTLGEAALLVRQADIGALLVDEGECLTGVVADRDLAVRGLADGLGADRPAREVMSEELRYCFKDEEADHVVENVAQLEERRSSVMDHNERLIGIVPLANIATCNTDKLSADLLRGVTCAHWVGYDGMTGGGDLQRQRRGRVSDIPVMARRRRRQNDAGDPGVQPGQADRRRCRWTNAGRSDRSPRVSTKAAGRVTTWGLHG